MKRSRAHAQSPLLRGPRALEARTFIVGDDRFVLFSFPVSEPELPRELSRAEREIVRGIVEGLTDREIAARNRTSIHTVRNQVAGILAKLRVASRWELIRRCSRSGGE